MSIKYTVTKCSEGDSKDWNVSGEGYVFANDSTLTCEPIGDWPIYLSLGQGIKCTEYSGGYFKFKSYLFISKANDKQSPPSGAVIYISSKGSCSWEGGSVNTTGLSSSYMDMTKMVLWANFGDYSATSYSTNGVIAVSDEFKVRVAQSVNVTWGVTIGDKSVSPGGILIITNAMSSSMTYNYNGFIGNTSHTSKQTGTIGDTITLVNASDCTKTPVTSSTTCYISFNTNGGEGSFNTISKTYSRSTTYTPINWRIDNSETYKSFGAKFTLTKSDHYASLNYSTRTPEYSYTSVTIPSNTPTKYGYTFANWSSNQGGSYAPGASIYLDKNYSLIAQYTANIYTIRYHADGWNNVPGESRVSYGISTGISNNSLSRNGCNWDGKWKTVDDRIISKGSYINTASYYDLATKHDNILDLYLNSYSLAVNKITLDPGAGSLSTSNIIEYNVETGTITVPQPTPPIGDYVFVGWTSNAAICGQTFTDVSVVTFTPSNETNWNRTNITLTARYVQLGKFVNIRGSWRPVMETYYKKNGQWVQTEKADDPNKGIGKTLIKVNGSWHREIGS